MKILYQMVLRKSVFIIFDDLVKGRKTDLFENLQSTNSGTYKLKNGEF